MAQAGRRWQRALFSWLTSYGFVACESDSCVFTMRRKVETPSGSRDDVLVVGCYVDDLFVLHNCSDEYSLYTKFTTDLGKRWDVDDEGDVSDLLNVEIERSDTGVTLRQTGYIEKLASKWLPDRGRPIQFPVQLSSSHRRYCFESPGSYEHQRISSPSAASAFPKPRRRTALRCYEHTSRHRILSQHVVSSYVQAYSCFS